MVKLADLNPLGAAHEIAKLRHILQLQAAGNAVGAAGGAASAATRETALMVGKTLNKLLNSVVTGPILMRFLRSNPDLCVTLLDLLLQPLVPVISMAVGKALIGLVKKPDEKEGGLKMVQLFPPVWEKAGDESKARSRGLRVPGGAALMKGSAAAGGALMRGGSAGLKKVKKPPRLLSFRKSKSYGASSETVDNPSGASTGSDEEAAEHTLEGIDEKQPVTPRLEKQLVTLQTGGSTPQTPRDGAGPPRGEGEAAEEAATAAVVDGAAAGGAKAEESQKKKEALVTVECVERLNVQYSDLTPGRVIPELSVGLSSLGVMKAVGAFTRAGMGAGKGVAAAPGKGVRTVMPRKGKKTYEDGFEAGFVAAHHTGPNLAEAAANCLNATPGLNKCVAKPRSLEEEKAAEIEAEKKLKAEVEKEWPVEWRDIKQHVIRMTVKVKIKLSLGQLDVSVGGKQWLGKLLSGFKLAEAQVAQLRLDRVAIEMRVRIFWYAKMEQMKIMVLKYPSPKLVDLTHELTLCSKLKVPPHLIKGAIEKLVLPFVTGRYFHVDLKPPPKKKGGKPGEVEVPEDAELPWHTEDPKCTDATGAGAEAQPVAA